MVLVFILLAIFILLLTIIFLVLLSTFRIEIKNLKLSNIENKNQIKKQQKSDFAIILSFYLFNKLKWISINLNDEKIKKAYRKIQLEKIDLKKLEKDFKWEYLKIIKQLHVKLSYINLKINAGVESPVITAFFVSILSTIISILLPFFAIDLTKENYRYTIQPIYKNKNLYKIQLNCIIQVKMVHIINVIYLFVKKGRSDVNGRTTSNRRPYGYSYE